MSPSRPIIFTAIPVAFGDDGSISEEGNAAILAKCAQSGVDGAFVLGTTGEFPSLSEDERRSLTRLSLDVLKGKRVVVHVGAPSFQQVERLIAISREEGATDVAVITPYFLPVSDVALVDFYKAVSGVSDGLNVFVYLFTDRTGVKVSPAVMAEIAKLPNIIGVKISGETLETVAEFRKVLPADFLVLTGSDRDIARLHTVGANGVISGIASVYPEPFVAVAEAVEKGQTDGLDALQVHVDAVVDGLLGDIGRLKAGLRRQGIKAGMPRMQCDIPSAETDALIDSLHQTYGTI